MATTVTFRRLIGVAVYESLILIALCMLGTAIFIAIFGPADGDTKRWGLRLFLWVLIGIYFVWNWVKSGQTLAMRTWRIQLINADAQALSYPLALKRYVLASASLLALGLGFIWAAWDKQQLFLHDRVLKTRFTMVT